MKNEILLYQSNELTEHIEVRIDEEKETIWLTQKQMGLLFEKDTDTIGLHLKNIYAEEELIENSTTELFSVVQKEGSRKVKRNIRFYNLDAILSVGYRVNSKRGTQFRQWATQRLKDYLLKGYALISRMNRIEDNVQAITERVNQIDLQINTHLIPNQGVFFDGQVFDAYELASKIIRSAKESMVLIDNYVDESTLTIQDSLVMEAASMRNAKPANKQALNHDFRDYGNSFIMIDFPQKKGNQENQAKSRLRQRVNG